MPISPPYLLQPFPYPLCFFRTVTLSSVSLSLSLLLHCVEQDADELAEEFVARRAADRLRDFSETHLHMTSSRRGNRETTREPARWFDRENETTRESKNEGEQINGVCHRTDVMEMAKRVENVFLTHRRQPSTFNLGFFYWSLRSCIETRTNFHTISPHVCFRVC